MKSGAGILHSREKERAIKEAIKRAKMEGAKGALITSGRRIAETASGFKKNTSVGLDL